MHASAMVKCPDEGSWTVTLRVHDDARVEVLGYDEPEDGEVEALARALWVWSWTVEQAHETYPPYPYERLIEATKNDLRRHARTLLRNDPDSRVVRSAEMLRREAG